LFSITSKQVRKKEKQQKSANHRFPIKGEGLSYPLSPHKSPPDLPFCFIVNHLSFIGFSSGYDQDRPCTVGQRKKALASKPNLTSD
jgi:hypothetical protein